MIIKPWYLETTMRACRYCQKSGHNIATCRDYRNALNSGLAQALNFPTNSKVAQRKKERAAAKLGVAVPQAPAPTYTDSYGRQRKQKTCSYCGTPGHTVRRCSKKRSNENLSANRVGISNNRKLFVEQCKKSGFGVGSLIKAKSGFANEWFVKQYGTLLMVIGFHSEKIGVGGYPFESSIKVKGVTTGKIGEINVPKHLYVEMMKDAYSYGGDDNLEVIKNPSKCYLPEEMLSEDWVSVKGTHAEDVKKHL